MKPTFTLPISPDYVSHWGLWEAIRELLQNAMDEADNSGVPYACDYSESNTSVSITSSGTLKPSSLILGNTTKTGKNQRGKFGEGYKLALLVLTRLGYHVQIFTDGSKWSVAIEHDANYDANVLNVYVEPSEKSQPNQVRFSISGVPAVEWWSLQRNFINSPTKNEILDDPEQAGRVYVGGLFVCHLEKYKCGYSFVPGAISLDRDRGMVNGFDLSYLTSSLWASHKLDNRAIELIKEEAPDVSYVTSHAYVPSTYTPSHAYQSLPSSVSPIVAKQHEAFVAEHGVEAIPVTTQEEVEKAAASGKKWVLVPSVVKSLLYKVRDYFIPSSKSPADRLADLVKEYEYSIPTPALREIEDVIKVLRNAQ